MPIQLDHTVVTAHDREAAARFFTEIFGLDDPVPFGPFLAVHVNPGLTLDYIEHAGEIPGQHYAFLVSEEEFDAIFGRVQRYRIPYWADPHMHLPQEINTNDGGRGVYFNDPSGHHLEIITRRYGSGAG